MSGMMYVAIFFTVALLVTTGYPLMGSVPLLILKHDTPMDSRFIRGFFRVNYKIAMFTATATAASFALAGHLAFAAGAAGLAILAAVLHGTVIPRMNQLLPLIQDNDAGAISRFRKTHITAILINLCQIVAVVWSLLNIRLY